MQAPANNAYEGPAYVARTCYISSREKQTKRNRNIGVVISRIQSSVHHNHLIPIFAVLKCFRSILFAGLSHSNFVIVNVRRVKYHQHCW